jgi:hypothetical protein
MGYMFSPRFRNLLAQVNGKAPTRRLVLLLILLVGVVAIRVVMPWPVPRISVAFLTKQPNYYLVTWRDANGEVRFAEHAGLDETLGFIKDDLHLKVGRNMNSESELEHLWMQDRYGTFVLLWKHSYESLVHQLTFHNEQEAKFFATAFRKGAYSRSVLGHSILLVSGTR